MRIPFPTRIPIKYLTLFAVVVAALQLAERTTVHFTLFAFLFIMMAGVAFNVAGGLSQVSGNYIFFFSTLTAIIGWIVKIVVGEAADSNLLVPELTVEVYAGTMFSMLVAVILSKRVTPKEPWLKNFLTDDNARASAIGCTVVGIFLLVANYVIPRAAGDLLSAAEQVNPWPLIAMIIAIQYEIRRSGGTRSLNAIAVMAGASLFIFSGILGFSKSGLFTPLLAYVVAAASLGFRFSLKQVVIGFLGLYFMLHFMVPYSQYGRTFKSSRDASWALLRENAEAAVTQLSDLGSLRRNYDESVTGDRSEGALGSYFNSDQGLFDRLHMIGPDDKLIDATEEGRNQYGLYPIWYAVINIVPHFIWKDKPDYAFGNLYLHEIMFYQGDDYTTGISFSPAGQAYHMAKWYSVFFVAPIIFFVTFVFFDSLCGDLRLSPWGLVAAAVFSHIAPEGMLILPISEIAHTGLNITLAAYFCAYVLPILGGLIIGPQKKRLVEGAS
jgi:hypothetical protein